jgi:hypothetical protein
LPALGKFPVELLGRIAEKENDIVAPVAGVCPDRAEGATLDTTARQVQAEDIFRSAQWIAVQKRPGSIDQVDARQGPRLVQVQGMAAGGRNGEGSSERGAAHGAIPG